MLHVVPVGTGASDIDNVLIGPAGVFMLNTKNHTGQKVWVGVRAILVDGPQQHYLSHSRHEAARVGKQLSAAVGAPPPWSRSPGYGGEVMCSAAARTRS